MTVADEAPAPGVPADLLDRGRRHLWVHTRSIDDYQGDDSLLVLRSGRGIWLRDDRGRTFLDAMSGLWVVAVGHGRAELAEVAAHQSERLAFANPFAYATQPAIELAARLAALAPPGLERAFFTPSGSEAVEAALRIAKQFHHNRGERKRYKVISRIGSYHGVSAGAMSANTAAGMNRAAIEPLMPGSVHVPGVHCGRCPYEKEFPSCNVFCARAIEQFILAERPETVAALIAEPVSSSNGCFLPPAAYWRTLRELCDRYGILLVADEVITGFGRTGRWFGMEHFGVSPDLMTVAKGITSGYQPLAGVVVSDRVAEAFSQGPSSALVGGSTWAAHPVACAVALANLDIIEREGLVERSSASGAHLAARLAGLVERHPVVGATRGVGLMHAVDLKDPVSGASLISPEAGTRLTALLRAEGVLCRAGASINLAPPLVITTDEIDDLVERVDRALVRFARTLAA